MDFPFMLFYFNLSAYFTKVQKNKLKTEQLYLDFLLVNGIVISMDQLFIAVVILAVIIGFIYSNPVLNNGQAFNFNLASMLNLQGLFQLPVYQNQQSTSTESETMPTGANTGTVPGQYTPPSGYGSGTNVSQQNPSLIDTFITDGPKNGEIITDTTQVTFTFSSRTQSDNYIYCETKLIGLDQDWLWVSGNSRTIILPAGTKTYTFLVRAKAGDVIDQTPAQTSFTINVSPYWQKITISTVSPDNSYNKDLITLNTNLSPSGFNRFFLALLRITPCP